nr:Major sperm protein domain containing protein [Haemonchus contortus]
MIGILVQLLLISFLVKLLLCGKKAKKGSGPMSKSADKEPKASDQKEEAKESKEEKKPDAKVEGGSKEKDTQDKFKTDKTMASKVEEVKAEDKTQLPADPVPPEGGEKKGGSKEGGEKKGGSKEGTKATPANADGEKKEGGKMEAAKGEGDKEGKPLKFSATQLEWDEKGGQQTLTVTNTTDVKQCMKIKSSDNKLFKVHPVYSNVDPGQSQEITVRRDAGPVKSDKIVIVTAPNKDDDDPEKLFEKTDLKLAVSVVRQTGKGETKPDEEKPKEEK